MKYDAKKLGPLPHDIVNRTLSLELGAGRVYLSARAHRHIAEDHPADYRLVIENLEIAVLEPTFLGQAPHHTRNFEAVKRIAVTEADENGRVLRRRYVLIAVSLVPDRHGDYRIVSGYTLKEEEVQTRRNNGRLLIPKK